LIGPGVSEECIASIFKFGEKTKQKPAEAGGKLGLIMEAICFQNWMELKLRRSHYADL
jgi:hypothetical protein